MPPTLSIGIAIDRYRLLCSSSNFFLEVAVGRLGLTAQLLELTFPLHRRDRSTSSPHGRDQSAHAIAASRRIVCHGGDASLSSSSISRNDESCAADA
jgi:hypothetical protein